MVIENIPYYNFSEFPVSSDRLLEIVNSAVKRNFKKLIINFGNSFPWSVKGTIVPESAFPEKVIDKIVTICRHREITLIPVLSLLTESDYIICNKNYQYLITSLNGRSILNPSASGAAKFIEELMEDIFSLFIYSDSILFELPEGSSNLSDSENDLALLLKRLIRNSEDESIHLIFTEKIPFPDNRKQMELSENIAPIYQGKSCSVALRREIIDIGRSSCRIFSLEETHQFLGFLDPGDYTGIIDGNQIDSTDKYNDLAELDDFFLHLDTLWSLIRECREFLSLLYTGTDYIIRVKFSRSVKKLLSEYSDILKKSQLLILKYKLYYQSGIIERWISSRINPASLQVNDLELIAKQIDGNL